ncbi:transposase InsO family protein [Rhodoblastus sphagnicola]|uniref:integrase core domain-containing protein n=1 Tax=Rhodoblastus sphagnicola TaxID=333368 RepID=UPI000CEC8357|nr:transposase InsO family protein [Rhodoblastus sphagnicola]
MNSDQASQFTSFAWTDRLKQAGVMISMDGKGRCIDTIFIERLWRSLKYECVYRYAWETGSQARTEIARWITFYDAGVHTQFMAGDRLPWSIGMPFNPTSRRRK